MLLKCVLPSTFPGISFDAAGLCSMCQDAPPAPEFEKIRGELRARLEAVIATAAMSEAGKSTWCREHGVYPGELDKWRANCATALADPEDARASPQATRADRKRIKELERDLLRKDRALAETAALLVLSKKVQAIFNKGEDE